MAIKLTLNPKNDQLVPIKALQDWSTEYLEKNQEANWIKKLFSGEKGKVKRERIGEINNVIKGLKPNGSNRAWFLKVFLKPWGGKVTDEAKSIFEALSDDKAFDKLQQAADQFNANLKQATDAAALAAKALTDRISNDTNGLAKIAADFSKEFNKSNPKAPAKQPETPAVQPALVDAAKSQDAFTKALTANKNQPITKPQWMKALLDELNAAPANVATAPAGGGGGALEESSIVDRFKMDKKLYEAGLIERSEYLASIVDVRNHLNEGSREANRSRGGRGSGGGRGKRKRVEAKAPVTNAGASEKPVTTPAETEDTLQQKLTAKGLTKAVVDAEWTRLTTDPANNGKFVAQPAAPVAAPATTTNENINKSFMLTKRLYEAGLIDRSEYLAALVKTKKVLAEQSTSASAPAAPAAATGENPAISAIGSAISTIIGNGSQKGALTFYLEQSAGWQDTLTKSGQQQVSESVLTPTQQQLAKLYFKKRVLSEYAKTGEVANKIQLNEFFLTALLLSALAGAIAWATSKLAGLFKDSYTGYSSSNNPPSGLSGNPQQEVATITGGIGAGMDADGNLVDGSGKKVQGYEQSVAKYIAEMNKYTPFVTKAVTDINTNVPSIIPALAAAPAYISFKEAFTASPIQEVNAFLSKLDAIKAFL